MRSLLTTDQNYEFTVQPGDAVVLSGSYRNAYSPGSDYLARSASRVMSDIPDGQFVPDGVTFRTGLADLTGDAALNADRTDQGLVLEFTSNDARFLNYIDGEPSTVVSYSADEWERQVFDEGYSLSDHAVKGFDGNLYGAGEQSARLLYRDEDGNEQFVEVAALSEPEEPVVDEYNLFVTAAYVEVDADADAVTMQTGPLNYANRTDNAPPKQVKAPKYREVAVNDTLGDDNFTVLNVYRVKEAQRYTSATLASVEGISETTDAALEAREVHPDFLTFNGVDETVDANWETPPGMRPAEVPFEELQFSAGDVALDLDSNNERRGFWRGDTELRADSGGGGPFTEPSTGVGSVDASEISQRLSEFYYLVVLGQVADTAETIDLVKPVFGIRR